MSNRRIIQLTIYTLLLFVIQPLLIIGHRLVKRQIANNYGYGPFGVAPSNGGFDSFGYYKNKFSNNGASPTYSFATYRNYYFEFNAHRSRYGLPAPTDYDTVKQEKNGNVVIIINIIFSVQDPTMPKYGDIVIIRRIGLASDNSYNNQNILFNCF
jgi:hypothetical protein